jgi:hypothetical protein
MTGTFARWKPFALALAVAVFGMGGPASALDLSVQGARSSAQGIVVPGASQLELDTYRSIQSRENFQFQQRINREMDRGMNMQPAPQPQVPVVQPSCQRDVNGSHQTRGCR